MNFQLEEVVAQFSWYMLPFMRMTGFMMVAPVFSTGFVPRRVRIGLSVMLALIVMPNLTPDSSFDPVSLGGVIMLVQQMIIGIALGFVMQLIFAAIVNAGQLVGMQMGLGFAQMMDPTRLNLHFV